MDVGSRREKIRGDALCLDVEERFRPDVCASAEYLPFRLNSFDCVTMLEVIEHLEDKQMRRALREMKRVAPRLVLSTPNCDSKIWSEVVWPLWCHTVGREWIGAHKQFFGKESLRRILEDEFGMEILERNFSRWGLLLVANTEKVTRIERPLLARGNLSNNSLDPNIPNAFLAKKNDAHRREGNSSQ